MTYSGCGWGRARTTVGFIVVAMMVGGVASLGLAPQVGAQGTGQVVDVEQDAQALKLLGDAIDAVSDNDEARLAELLEMAERGEVWLPDLTIDAIADRDAEVLVLSAQLLDQDAEGLEDMTYDFVVYERDLLIDARAGDPDAQVELGWADDEGQAILQVLERRGTEISDASRTVLGPLSLAGGVAGASVDTYDDVLDEIDAEGSDPLMWIVAALVIIGVALVGFFVIRGRRSEAMANSDALTGLANRRRFERDIDRRSNQSGPTAVLMIDVDHFKVFNDTHGHALGDEVLRHVGTALQATFRDGDVPYRYGGEEFCVLLPDTSPPEAMQAGERARGAIEAIDLAGGLRVTASVGVALTPAARVGEALEAADQALYEAKGNGRNRVEFASVQ